MTKKGLHWNYNNNSSNNHEYCLQHLGLCGGCSFKPQFLFFILMCIDFLNQNKICILCLYPNDVTESKLCTPNKKMENKIKTILFAFLIATMILPFSGMNYAEAITDKDTRSREQKLAERQAKLDGGFKLYPGVGSGKT